MKKKFYKVVTSSLLSLYATNHIEYEIGEWVSAPENTRLFVFDDLDEAKNYAKCYDKIFECSVIGKIKFKGSFFIKDNTLFWKIFNKQIKAKKKINADIFAENKITLAEVDAVLAKKVRLDKQVF